MNMFRLWRLFHRSAPAHIQPHLCAGHRCLRIRHRRLPNRARRPAWLHLAGLRRPHVRLHDQFQQVRARYIRNMVQNPGARRQARRHGRRRPLDGRPGTAVMNTYSDGYVLLAAFASLLLIVPFVALAGSAAVSQPPAGTHVSPHCDLRAPPPRRSRNSPRSMRVARLCLARWSAWPATSR